MMISKIYKLITNYFIYKKLMSTQEKYFINALSLRKDWLGRYYTVINLQYDKNYGMDLIKKGLNKFKKDFDSIRMKTGLIDLIKIKTIISIDAINYKAIIGYNNGLKINKVKLYTNLILLILASLIGYIIYSI